jgi:hypothetical protein
MKTITFCIGIGLNQLLPDFIEIGLTKELIQIEFFMRNN